MDFFVDATSYLAWKNEFFKIPHNYLSENSQTASDIKNGLPSCGNDSKKPLTGKIFEWKTSIRWKAAVAMVSQNYFGWEDDFKNWTFVLMHKSDTWNSLMLSIVVQVT